MSEVAVGSVLPDVVAGVILASLILYALLGGADFGGGLWDLLATGPRAEAQRRTIAQAIGPIWEANHVWMIVAIVLLFTAFPTAFSVIMTALHIPITIMLFGIVLRGSSFVFRKYGSDGEGESSGWQVVFAVSSMVTPIMLGVVVGALSSGAIGYRDGLVTGGFVRPWLSLFPFVVGFFTLALFAFLAAVYLTLETPDPDLREDFRTRALWAAGGTALLGAVGGILARTRAPEVADNLMGTWGGRGILVAGAVALVLAVAALVGRRYGWARFFAAGLVILVLVGWGVGMHPWLVPGAVDIHSGAAPLVTLRIVTWILALGSVVLVPAYVYLYATFKKGVLWG